MRWRLIQVGSALVTTDLTGLVPRLSLETRALLPRVAATHCHPGGDKPTYRPEKKGPRPVLGQGLNQPSSFLSHSAKSGGRLSGVRCTSKSCRFIICTARCHLRQLYP